MSNSVPLLNLMLLLFFILAILFFFFWKEFLPYRRALPLVKINWRTQFLYNNRMSTWARTSSKWKMDPEGWWPLQGLREPGVFYLFELVCSEISMWSWFAFPSWLVLLNIFSCAPSPCVYPLQASLLAQLVKNLPSMQEPKVQPLGLEDPVEKEIATHSTILAWRIPW